MTRRLFGLVVAALVAMMCPGAGSAQENGETVGLAEIGQGSLLVPSEIPGRYREVPLQRTDVEITVTGMVAEAAAQGGRPRDRGPDQGA